MRPCLHVFHHLDTKEDFSTLWSNVATLADGDIEHEATMIGAFSEEMQTRLADLCSDLSHNKSLRNYEIIIPPTDESWMATANLAIEKDTANSGAFLFFISSDVAIHGDTAERLLSVFNSSPELAGVNPLFLSGKWEGTVAHMGTVADSQGDIHYLYEGLGADDPLAQKTRFFQLAHGGALLIRKADFLAISGFNPDRDMLAFSDFCLRLCAAKTGRFSTVPQAKAILRPQWDSMRVCGLWNSLLMRGKLPHDLLAADYPIHALSDNMSYGLTGWVRERAIISLREMPADLGAWLEWRHNPSPFALMEWLKFLAESDIREFVEVCRSFPSFLPCEFGYYAARARSVRKFAIDANIACLGEDADKWLANASRFHYRALKPGMKMLKNAGFYNCSLDVCPSIYDAWLEASRGWESLQPGATWPKIAIAMPVWNTNHGFLRQAIESVKGQSYGNWELCIADDCSTDPEIPRILEACAADDARIKVSRCQSNLHICGASNLALGLVSAPWVGFLDHDDMLSRECLEQVAAVIAENEDLGFIYTDEDHINEQNVRRTPFFKPDFDPELTFIGHFSCYRTALVREARGFRKGYEGSQDFDLFLRITENLAQGQIKHIPKILYHWRVHAESTAASIAAKPYALSATQKAWEARASRMGEKGTPVPTQNRNFYKIFYAIPADFKFSLVLMDVKGHINAGLKKLVNHLRASYAIRLLWQPMYAGEKPGWVVDFPDMVLGAFRGGGWTKAIQAAANMSDNEILLFMRTDLEPLPDCAPAQLAYLLHLRKDAAAVGSMLWHGPFLWNGGYYPDITGKVFPLLRGVSRTLLPSYCWGQFLLTRQTLGFPGQCFAIRSKLARGKFFDESMGNFITCDFAMHMLDLDLRVLISPWGQWRYDPDKGELEETGQNRFKSKWGEKVRRNGLRNANFRAAPDQDWGLVF